jgi:hypothetical protein
VIDDGAEDEIQDQAGLSSRPDLAPGPPALDCLKGHAPLALEKPA